MLATCAAFLVATVLAQDVAPSPAPEAAPAEETETEDLSSQLAVLEQRIAELEAAQEQAALDALLAEAEALAAATPAPQPAPQARVGAFNPGITAFGDGFWTVGVQDGAVLPESGPWLRSLELDLRADVDPHAKAVAVIAFEQEPPLEGEEPGFGVSPEEVYINLVSLPGGLSATVGLFRVPFGIANRMHPHDLPWTSHPLANRDLLGEEGYADTGAVVSWRPRVALPVALTATAGALAGDPFSDRALTPGWLGRVEGFADLGAADLALGASAAGRGSHAVYGGDLMARWKGSSWRSLAFIAEVLGDTTGELGGYAALQVQPTRPVYLGARLDWVGDQLGGEVDLSYYTSEFLRVRMALGFEDDTWLAQTQLTFVWGSHPVEPYWVNR